MVSMFCAVSVLLIDLLGHGEESDLEVWRVCGCRKCGAGHADVQDGVGPAESPPEHSQRFHLLHWLWCHPEGVSPLGDLAKKADVREEEVNGSPSTFR